MPNPIVFLQSLLEPIEQLIPNQYLAEFIIAFLEISILLLTVTFTLNFVKQLIHQRHFDATLGATGLKGALAGALVGTVTPVCSCSVSGLYAGLLSSGASRVAATSFLFAAPAVNEFAIAAMFTVAGAKGAFIYALVGILAAIITGLFSHKLGIKTSTSSLSKDHDHSQGFMSALQTTLSITKSTILNLLPALVIGVTASIVLKQLLPDIGQIITNIGSAWYGPILATSIGLPLHIEAVSATSFIIPIIKVGLPLGTGISLLMAATISSVSEMAILPKVIGKIATTRLVVWYFIYCSGIGLLLNFFF